MGFSVSNTFANANSASDKSQWWFGPHLNEEDNENEALEAVMDNGHWEDDGEQLCQENIVQMKLWNLRSTKDALCIHVNKIGNVTNESTQGKLHKKYSVPQVLYTDGHESWMIWETIPSRLKRRKEAREMQCFDHLLLGRENFGSYQLGRRGHIARQIALGRWRMWKQDHFGNAKRWLCFGKRHKIANLLGSRWDCMDQVFQMAPPCKPDQLFSQLCFLQLKQYRK